MHPVIIQMVHTLVSSEVGRNDPPLAQLQTQGSWKTLPQLLLNGILPVEIRASPFNPMQNASAGVTHDADSPLLFTNRQKETVLQTQ